MPQTLMAFLAMTIAALATLSQLSAQIETYDEVIKSEYELMANAEVIERMEIIALGTDYDELQNLDGDEVSSAFTLDDLSITFDLIISVEFVDDDGIHSDADTGIKQVTIEGYNDRFTEPLVTHNRMFSE